MRVVLVSPPRRIWPYVDEQDNYLLPQWMACIGAYLRAAGVDVVLLDCMPLRLGWASLERRLRELRPDVLATGENHAVYASEVLRLVRLAKDLDPDVVTVVGGGHFTNSVELYLHDHPIDFIARGEGEVTLYELMRALEAGGLDEARQVGGVVFSRDGEAVYTPPRALVDSLDDLPMPAFDLLPMERYGSSKYLYSPGGTTIHHGRGCVGQCTFCVWWKQMADRKVTGAGGCRNEQLTPRWRTKSVDRTLAEMEVLYRTYNKRCLVFVDPTFNVDPAWNEEFALKLIRKKWDLSWFGFMRAEYILRDERSGIFEAMVRSGLVHVCIGVERIDAEEMRAWRKPIRGDNQHIEVFRLLRDKYPQVFRQASFIMGTRGETPATMEAHFDFARRLRVDYPAFHPLTPFPGTDIYREAKDKGWLEITDLDEYDLMTPVMSSDHMTRQEIEDGIVDMNRRSVGPRWLLRGLLSRSTYRRNMYIWWLLVTGRIFAQSVKSRVNPFGPEPYKGLYRPDWYES